MPMPRIQHILWLEKRLRVVARKRQLLSDWPLEAERLDAEWKRLDDLRQYHLARTIPYEDWMLEVLRSDFSREEVLMIHLGRLKGASRVRVWRPECRGVGFGA